MLSAVCIATATHTVYAANKKIRINGFINGIYSVSSTNTKYLSKIDNQGDWSANNFGLNLSAQLDHKLSIAAQIMGGGTNGNNAVFDWGFGKYEVSEGMAVKAGKMKYTGTLVSDYVEVGYSYLWVRPPESIYYEKSELSFESYNGAAVEFMGGDDVEYTVDVYAGEIVGESETFKKMLGTSVLLVTENAEFKLGANQSTILVSGEPENGRAKTIVTAGAKFNLDNWLIMTEYAANSVEGLSNLGRYGAYVTLAYKMGKTTPHFTLQKHKMNSGKEQDSITLGVKRQISQSMVAKFELQQARPKNGGMFAAQPTQSTVNLINAAVNFVF